MPRAATGTTHERNGRWFAQVTLDKGDRPEFALPKCESRRAAEERTAKLAAMAQTIRGKVDSKTARALLARAASASTKAFPAMEAAAKAIAAGEARPIGGEGTTVADLAELWTSGELARQYPDHIRAKRTVRDDRWRFETYILPLVGHVRIVDFTLDHADHVMRSLPSEHLPSTRRNIAVNLHRLMAMAVYPLRIRPDNPLPRGFLPKMGNPPAKTWLYPSEEAALLGCTAVPLPLRMLYGFLAREGPRVSTAAGLQWRHFDLERGVIRAEYNKSDDHSAVWALTPGVAPALAAWRKHLESRGVPTGPDAFVFVEDDGEKTRAWLKRKAKKTGKRLENKGMRLSTWARGGTLRGHIKMAGLTRAELFEHHEARLPLRIHDLRATFVTLSLAAGRSEAWVMDRTSHKSSDMIQRYRRAARLASELGLGELHRLDTAIPELRPAPPTPEILPISEESQDEAQKSSNDRNDQNSQTPQIRAEPPWGFEPQTCGLRKEVISSTYVAKGRFPEEFSGAPTTPGAESRPPLCESPLTPRARLLAGVARSVAELVEVGDMGAARAALRMLTDTLAEGEGAAPDGVIDLAQHRAAQKGGDKPNR